MTDQEYGEDSQKMIGQILLIEFRIKGFNQGIEFSERDWFKYLEGVNIGREILDRGFLKVFFGGGPKGINKRIRKALIQLMLKTEKEFPTLKGPNFDESLKELIRKDMA